MVCAKPKAKPRVKRDAVALKHLSPVAAAFMRHPRHAAVSFNDAQKAFVVAGKGRVRGLNRWLDEALMPPAAEDVLFSGVRAHRAARNKTCQGTGAAHGSLVDVQLQRWVSTGSLRGADPCAVRLARAILRLRLRPVGCQIMVWDGVNRWATALDCLAVDATGALCVLEFKCTAYPALYATETTPMRGPLATTKFSLYARHQMQVALPVAALMRQYDTPVAAAYVLVASPPNVVDVYALRPKFLRAALTFYRR
jgi:hypothetical protein